MLDEEQSPGSPSKQVINILHHNKNENDSIELKQINDKVKSRGKKTTNQNKSNGTNKVKRKGRQSNQSN